MKATIKGTLIAAVLASSGAAFAGPCHSVAIINGVRYESDKCNVSIVNNQPTFSDTPVTTLPNPAQYQLPPSISNYLQQLLASLKR